MCNSLIMGGKMQTVKFVSIFAAIGFFLSLICGFFSGSPFVRILLTAFIFAFVFALLSFLIKIIYNKFLTVESNSENNQGKSDDYVVTTSSVGNNVNLIVTDEDLEQSGNPNHYLVGNNHQMLNESDIKKEKDESPSENENNEFVPLRNFETVNNFSSNESVQANSVNSNNDVQNDTALDVLPDMSDMQVINASNNSEDSEIINNYDSDFIKSDVSYNKKDVDTGDVTDASIMAKAISSILSADT